MRGRKWFSRFKPILLGMAAILRILPDGFCAFLLTLMRNIPARFGMGLRYILLNRLAMRCGGRVAIHEGVYLFKMQFASFDDNISINPMCYIDATGGLTIGSNVSIAHGTTIMTTEHDFSQPDQNTRDVPVIKMPVKIGDDVWIGAGVRILAGVTLGDHVVIGAGAVVTKDIPSNTVAVGVPARPMKQVERNESSGSALLV